MSEKKDAFIEGLKKSIGYSPTKEEMHKGDIAGAFYENLRGGNVKRHTTATIALYTRSVLPELSIMQAMELAAFMHNIIETVLTYLVEDGLIKEE